MADLRCAGLFSSLGDSYLKAGNLRFSLPVDHPDRETLSIMMDDLRHMKNQLQTLHNKLNNR